MNMALRRRALIEQSLWLLPSGYQRVSYIASNGSNQYIDTDLYLTNDDTLYVDIMPTANVSQLRGVMGSRYGYTEKNFLIAVSSTTKISCQFANTEEAVSDMYLSTNDYLNQRIQVINGRYKRGIVGVGFNENEITDTFTTDATCRIFSGNSQYATRYFSGRIYLAEIKGRFFGVPCYRTSDSKIGMYDTIGKRFLTTPNGVFTKGVDI